MKTPSATWVLWLLQQALQVEDRVRYTSDFSTAPCLMKIAFPEEEGGCNRPFTEPTTFEALRSPTDYDILFTFYFGSPISTADKQVAFRCCPFCVRGCVEFCCHFPQTECHK